MKDITNKHSKIQLVRNYLGKIRWIKHILKLNVPPGHYYSPIPSIEEIKLRENEIFAISSKEIPGLDLNENEQIYLVDMLKKYYPEMPFGLYKKNNLRFCFENMYFDYTDAIFLYCMIRYLKPRKIIEIGSGYSSCVMLDTNELFFDNAISCTFIEPYPERLLSLIKKEDVNMHEIIHKKLQDIDINKFSELSEGDILFIDSSHVSKIGSDVNYILFKILPYIKSGIYVHFHDIFYPFEYPKKWIYDLGKAWNEAYLLRAFLQYNHSFKIQVFNDFIERFHKEKLHEMPLCIKNSGSIWINKI